MLPLNVSTSAKAQRPERIIASVRSAVSRSVMPRQQMAIARAMIDDSPMLIFDEATSSVDTRTEKTIQESLDRLSNDRTSFVIAHRLSTIRNSDLILVMKDGNVIEQGDHDALMAKGGFYSDLYNSRFIKAILINTSMSNCNLKKTAFYESAREGVSLKLSNTREALMDRSKGGMIGELGNARSGR